MAPETDEVAPNPRKPDFSSAILKVERANTHIADCDAAIGLYFSEYPYNVGQEFDLESGRHGFHLYARQPFPERRIALFIGDAVHNLRSALDHLIAACADANGKTFNDTQFVIGNDEGHFERRLKDGAKKAGPLAMEILTRLQPYSGGNDAFYTIHKLDLTDKHQLVLPVACTVDVTIATGAFNGLPVEHVSGSIYSGDNRSEFIPTPPGYETAIPMEMSFTGEVVFARDTLLAGQPCVATLRELSATVADAIHLFESEFDTVKLSSAIARKSQ